MQVVPPTCHGSARWRITSGLIPCYTCFAKSGSNERERAKNPVGAAVAHAPAFLQGHGYRRVSPSLGATSRPEGLLRDGEAGGGVSRRSPELQPGAIAD